MPDAEGPYMAFSWTGIPTLAGWIEGTALLIRSEQHFERNHLLKAPAHSVAHATLAAPQPSTKDLPTQLLSYARKRGGEFTLSDALIDTPYTIPEIEEALAQLAANGLARSELNLETGQMSYVFPDFKRLN